MNTHSVQDSHIEINIRKKDIRAEHTLALVLSHLRIKKKKKSKYIITMNMMQKVCYRLPENQPNVCVWFLEQLPVASSSTGASVRWRQMNRHNFTFRHIWSVSRKNKQHLGIRNNPELKKRFWFWNKWPAEYDDPMFWQHSCEWNELIYYITTYKPY